MAKSYQTGKHLEAFILLLISQHQLHGGAIIAELKSLLPASWTIDDGHVYRLLRQLEKDGALTSTWLVEQEGAPVRVYTLTAAGKERLRGWRDDIQLRVESLQRFLDLWREPK
ncbi:PadR family transcriptional regulator [Sulfobacillus harzensis]|uniref:PadR family transcriptional regulator n=1 Tax=Sulfobacillus harzensis TaxID=2729629 RepID=UPI001FAD7C89|nr:helix-turn-helix transcriptional regulator [Sulfobacillus harzensis]